MICKNKKCPYCEEELNVYVEFLKDGESPDEMNTTIKLEKKENA